MDIKNRERVTAVLCLMMSITCFGTVPIFIKHFTRYLDAWIVNGARYSTAAVFWMPFVFFLLKKNSKYKTIWRSAIVPSVFNLLGQVLWAFTPYYNDAIVINFVIRSSFLFTILFAMISLPGERVLIKLPSFWLGTVVCVIGVLTMYGASLKNNGESSPGGIALIVITSIFWGLYAVSVRQYLKQYPVRLSFGVVSLYTSMGLIILMLIKGDFSACESVSAGTWGLIMLSAMIGIAFAHVLLFKVINTLGPVVANGANLISPFVTWIGASLILGESMSLFQWLGGIILIIGAILLIIAQSGSIRIKTLH